MCVFKLGCTSLSLVIYKHTVVFLVSEKEHNNDPFSGMKVDRFICFLIGDVIHWFLFVSSRPTYRKSPIDQTGCDEIKIAS